MDKAIQHSAFPRLKFASLLDQMKFHLSTEEGKRLLEKVGLVHQLNIAPKKLGVDEEIYMVDLKKGKVTKGPYDGKPDVTFSFKGYDFLGIATGKMNPHTAFYQGSLKTQFGFKLLVVRLHDP